MNTEQKKVLIALFFILGGISLLFYLDSLLNIFRYLLHPFAEDIDKWDIRLFMGIILIGLGIFIKKGNKNK